MISSLPEAASEALESVAPPESLDARQVLEYAARTPAMPPQTSLDDKFGEPPLILHWEPDFVVQALIWMDGTTSIHEHSFAGAFMVLEGASLHVTHHFELGEALADGRLISGQLEQQSVEILGSGAVRAIEPGADFIHALFHLQMPTITVVVRNDSAFMHRPQYTYLRPGLGFDPFWKDRVFSKRVSSIDALTRLDTEAGWSLLEEMVEASPIWESFVLVERRCAQQGWTDRTAALAQRLTTRAPQLDGVLAPALAESAAVQRILLRRGMLRELHQRIFLALMANLREATDTLAVLDQLYAGQETDQLLLDWVAELSGPSLRGISGLNLSRERLEEIRAISGADRQELLLGEVRAAWGDPERSIKQLFG